MDDTKYTTAICQGKNQSPELNYNKLHHIDCVTKFLIDYLKEDKLTIKIYGNQDIKRKKGEAKSNQSSASRKVKTQNVGTTASSVRISKGADPLGGL
jgi:hypothetical protein